MNNNDRTLVQRLRDRNFYTAIDCVGAIELDNDLLDDLLDEAADRIERLEAALLLIAIPRVGGGQWASEIAKKVMGIGNNDL
jgi:hypothetical protein